MNLENQPITDISFLSHFPHITQLNLRGMRQIEDFSPLQNSQIIALNIQETNIYHLDFLAAMSCLKRLDASGCLHLTDVSGLNNCTALEELDLSKTDIFDPNLSNLVNLKALKISSNRLENIPWLSNCTALEELYLYGTMGIHSTNAFTPLRKLKKLILSCCGDVTDLSGLPSLEELHFSYGTRITDIDGLLRQLPTLRKLRLDSTLLLNQRIIDGLLAHRQPLVLFIEDSLLESVVNATTKTRQQRQALSRSLPREKQQIMSAIGRFRNTNVKPSLVKYMSF